MILSDTGVKVCKHFQTYGCKLGTRCRFLHCTQEELNKMSAEQGFIPGGRHHRGRGGRFDGPPRTHFEVKNGETFSLQSGPFHPYGPPPSSSLPSGHKDIKLSPLAAVSGHEEMGKEEVVVKIKEEVVVKIEDSEAGHNELSEHKQINL